MTNKEASAILELMAIDLAGALGGLSRSNPLSDVLAQRLEAISRAQAALHYRDESIISSTGGSQDV